MPLFTLGLDLGTKYSSIAYCVDNKVTVVKNGVGNASTPSFVEFCGSEVIVGESAKNDRFNNLINTIYDLKRLIGRKYDEKSIQEDIKHWHYKVVNDDNNPKIRIKMGEEEKDFAPYEISRYIIDELVKYTVKETDIGVDESKNVVITVPAYFNDDQRSEMRKMCELCKLNVLRIIDEPIAAALAFGYKNDKEKSNRRVLVYDFGGGSFNVTILEVKDNEISIKGNGGDDHLGGDKIDNNLVNYYCQRLYVVCGKYIMKDNKELSKLKILCEEAKIMLSKKNEAEVNYEMLKDNGISNILTREIFNRVNEKVFVKTIELVEKTLKECKLCKDDIDDVLLVGGSSKIPKVKEIINNYFSRRNIYDNINGEEVVAIGAALLAEDLVRGCEEKTYPNGSKVIIDSKSGNFVCRCNDIEPPESV